MPILSEMRPGQLWRLDDAFLDDMSKGEGGRKLCLTHLYALVIEIGEDEKGAWWKLQVSFGGENKGDKFGVSGMQKMRQDEIEDMLPGFVLVSEAP